MFVHEQKMKGKKKHAPAWCVRIICFGEELKHQDLSRGDSRLSDHCLVREIFVAESDVPSDSWSLGSSWCGAADSSLSGLVFALSPSFSYFPYDMSQLNVVFSEDDGSFPWSTET
ncbi:hypothetical protein D5086_029506 [Populus alba]|uniref:Uncharacterized protein n=1 Tax=Populus alba TaxID=43335 RepID=A0ACC4AUL2_POPAL